MYKLAYKSKCAPKAPLLLVHIHLNDGSVKSEESVHKKFDDMVMLITYSF